MKKLLAVTFSLLMYIGSYSQVGNCDTIYYNLIIDWDGSTRRDYTAKDSYWVMCDSVVITFSNGTYLERDLIGKEGHSWIYLNNFNERVKVTAMPMGDITVRNLSYPNQYTIYRLKSYKP